MNLTPDSLAALAAEHGTPLYVYDLDQVSTQLASLSAFDVVRYAQKANGCRPLLERLAREGARVDAVSAIEVERALRAGFAPERVSYTSDVFTRDALDVVAEHGIATNLGSMDMIEQLAARCPGASVTLRLNPGFGSGHHRRVTTGGATSKHGNWHTQLPQAVARLAAAGLRLSGLHVHVGSGADLAGLARTIESVEAALAACPDTVTSVSTGGGLPIPYREGEAPFDLAAFSELWLAARERWQARLGRALTLEVEPGRYLVAQCGVLVTEVRARKETEGYRYLLVDAGFATFLRPTLYGAYHRITALGEHDGPTRPYVVAGPLCESADVLTQGPDMALDPRELPDLPVGALLCVHDAGAYGMVMASNYNSMPLPAEVVVEGGVARLARRRQSADELFREET
ncbi:MAG: diaminopimelate decarboxylase [Planctomycetota bacterium]|nr:diaminopimelate decarboxylase [Planctomycetota bacterium]